VREKRATTEDLEQVYRRGFASFLRVATAITADQELGRDAVQTAFAAALRHRGSFRGDGTVEAWVWPIVVREARRLAKSRWDEATSLDATAELPTLAANGNGSEVSPVRRYIAALPARQREAVFLRYFADLDYKAIARVLDLEPGTVSATLSAAHQTLRKRVEATLR
jgi:RNA polymerase sigma-70 factor (ECF subfamily)